MPGGVGVTCLHLHTHGTCVVMSSHALVGVAIVVVTAVLAGLRYSDARKLVHDSCTNCTQHVLTFTRTHGRTDAQLKRRRTFETNNEKKIRKNKESMRNRSMAKRKAQSAAMGGFSGLLFLPPPLALSHA